MTFLVLGIDGASWNVIKPNLSRLSNFAKLVRIGRPKELVLREKPISAAIWCGMFCGKTVEEHGHAQYTRNGRIVKREDIPVKFIWDLLDDEIDVRVVNVPFVVPPYSFNVDFKPVGFGLPNTPKEWQEELQRVTETTKKLLSEGPDLLISVFTFLDRVQHFHWGEPTVLEWYERIDEKLGDILWDTGLLPSDKNKLILISDHGFCSFGEAKVQTLPKRTPYGELKGDHWERALLITVNVENEIESPQDVFRVLHREFAGNRT
jgi:predicted AlkP superfamily phosphohydrolase/phosphomutase